MQKKGTVTGVVCSLLILLFVYAALSKLSGYDKFSVQLAQSPLLAPAAGWIARAVPVSELLLSAMLFFPRSRLAGMYGSFLLMLLFTVYIILILGFSEKIPCSCGGILESMGWKTHLAFNVCVCVMIAWAIVYEERPYESAS